MGIVEINIVPYFLKDGSGIEGRLPWSMVGANSGYVERDELGGPLCVIKWRQFIEAPLFIPFLVGFGFAVRISGLGLDGDIRLGLDGDG